MGKQGREREGRGIGGNHRAPCHFDGTVPISPVAKATCSAFFVLLARTHTHMHTPAHKIAAVVNCAAIAIVVVLQLFCCSLPQRRRVYSLARQIYIYKYSIYSSSWLLFVRAFSLSHYLFCVFCYLTIFLKCHRE